jgi:hypothetical protein
MSNETIVIAQERLFINFSDRRITGLPAAGTIASITKADPDADMVAGLHRTVVAVINGSDVYDVVINLLAPFGQDHAWFEAARKLTRKEGAVHSLKVTYEKSTWVSNAIVITSIGALNLNADGVEVLPINLRGSFEVINVASFSNPPIATAAQIQALIPA